MYAGGIAVFAVGLWAAFIADVATQERRLLQVSMRFSPPADTAGVVLLAVFSAAFLGYGLHHIVFRQRWARWNEWLHNTQVPLDAEYGSGDIPAARASSHRWVAAMVAVGVCWTLVGVMLAVLCLR